MSKRRRVSAGFSRSTRQIDKALVFVKLDDISATQQSRALTVGKTPCTVLGVRWSMFIEGDAGSVGVDHDYAWAIVLVRESQTASTLDNVTNGNSFYDPEQDVIAFGVGFSHASSSATTGVQDAMITGKTKAMRKLRVGDQMQFIIRGIATETVRMRGCIQLFCKS